MYKAKRDVQENENPISQQTDQGTKISLIVPYSTDLSSLNAEFYHTGKSATVNGIEQISGQTLNSYSQALAYTITAANATQKSYTLSTAKGSPDSNTLFGFQFDSLLVPGVICIKINFFII